MQTRWFKQRMRRLRVTQEHIGRVLNCDRSVVSRIIGGKQELALSQVLPLAAALQASPFEILHRAGIWDMSTPDALRRHEWFDLFEQMPAEEQARALNIVRALRQG